VLFWHTISLNSHMGSVKVSAMKRRVSCTIERDTVRGSGARSGAHGARFFLPFLASQCNVRSSSHSHRGRGGDAILLVLHTAAISTEC
jgi:hypothetical protein